MAIDPESFDEPVVDYDFAKISTPRSLIDQMSGAGGFTATKLAYARDILKQMNHDIQQVDADPAKVTNWLSFPCMLCATGTRDSLSKHSKEICSMWYQQHVVC